MESEENANEKEGEDQEDFLYKKLDLPIQAIERHRNLTEVEKLEKTSFIDRKPKVLKTSFRDYFRYQNPLREKDPLQQYERNPEINTISAAQRTELFACGYSNGEIHIFNQYHDLKIIQDTYDTILGLKINPNNNNILISLSSMGDLIHTHVGSAKKLNEFRIEKLVPRCMDYNDSTQKIAVGFAEGNINIYNDEMQSLEGVIKSGTSFSTGHVNQIHSVSFNKKNRNILVSGGRDKRVMIWDLRKYECTGMVLGPFILGDAVDIKGNYIVCGSYEKQNGCYLYDIRKFKDPVKQFRTDSKIYSCKFSKKEGAEIFAAAGCKVNVLKIYNINEKEYISGNDGCSSPCYALDFSPDGNVLAFGCKDGDVRVVDLL